MPKILLTAQVQDAAKWENSFRTHGELLKSMSSTAIHYTVTKGNEVGMCAEVKDAAKYFEVLESKATLEAMAQDGVKRETVKTFVLDKEFKF
jgi:hypothetical protein